MKKVIVVLFTLCSLMKNSQGQGIDNLWLMGIDCCHPPYFYPMNLDFSSGSLVIDTVQRGMNINCTNGVISNKQGNLLFYSNGVYVANSNNDTMLNGSGLNPCYFTDLRTQDGLTIPQANLIIPFPDDSTKYYLFHETSDDAFYSWSPLYLYYSIIDMTLDNGLGGVVQKNTILLNDTVIGGRLTACKHANGRDWWLVVPDYLNGNYFVFLISPQGISAPIIQNMQTSRDNYFGQCVFSKQGDKYAFYEPYTDLDIFDFDRCTGVFSNRIHVVINDSANGAGGVAFSPSGRFLYVSSDWYVYQFNMQANDIALSQTTVAVWDSTYLPNAPFATRFYLAQLAPDNKIYINCPNSTTSLHVINYPDSLGLACDVCQNCILLPGINTFTIPNYPNYFLGPETGSACDTLNIGLPEISTSMNSYTLFPNPVKDLFYISGKKGLRPINFRIYNVIGQQQDVSYSLLKNGEYIEVNSVSLHAGMYVAEFVTDKEKVVLRFVKD